MKLKKTCRTCKYLNPSTYTSGYWDAEENYFPENYPCNCDYRECDEDVDDLTNCAHYVPVDEKFLYEEE